MNRGGPHAKLNSINPIPDQDGSILNIWIGAVASIMQKKLMVTVRFHHQ